MEHVCGWPELKLVVTMPLAMLHLRSLRESMLKAARPFDHLVWRALTNFRSLIQALIYVTDG